MGRYRLIALVWILFFTTQVWATTYYTGSWTNHTAGLSITNPSPTSLSTSVIIQDNNSVSACGGLSWYDVLYVDNIQISNCSFSGCVFNPSSFSLGSHNVSVHAHTINPNGYECDDTNTLALVVGGTSTPTSTATAGPTSTPTAIVNVAPQTTFGPVNTDSYCNSQALAATNFAETSSWNTNDGTGWNANNQSLTNPAYYTNNAGRCLPIPNSDLSAVDGAFTGTTQQIIRWAACKWGVDENMAYAESQEETGGWHNDCASLHGGTGCNEGGDCGNPDADSGGETASLSYTVGSTTFPVTNSSSAFIGNTSAGNGSCGQPFASWSIIQSKASKCEWYTWPMLAISTAWGEDYRWAKFRACVNGDYQTRFNNQGQGTDYGNAVSRAKTTPTGVMPSGTTGPNFWVDAPNETNLEYLVLGCICTHFSGDWYSSSAQTYCNNLKTIFTNHSWPGGIVGP